jgi:hypothetical protein
MDNNINQKKDIILRVKVLATKLNKVPTLEECTEYLRHTEKYINKLFGSYNELLLECNLKYSDESYKENNTKYLKSIAIDMEKLNNIMNKFNLFPVRDNDQPSSNPIHRLIFCNILADKYEELRGEQKLMSHGYPRTPVSKFLGYNSNNAIKFQVRENAIDSIKIYKEYWSKYKVIKSAFNDDARYIELLNLEKLQKQTDEKMQSLMIDILKE